MENYSTRQKCSRTSQRILATRKNTSTVCITRAGRTRELSSSLYSLLSALFSFPWTAPSYSNSRVEGESAAIAWAGAHLHLPICRPLSSSSFQIEVPCRERRLDTMGQRDRLLIRLEITILTYARQMGRLGPSNAVTEAHGGEQGAGDEFEEGHGITETSSERQAFIKIYQETTIRIRSDRNFSKR